MADAQPAPALPTCSDRLPGSTADAVLLAGRLALGIIFVKRGVEKLSALSA